VGGILHHSENALNQDKEIEMLRVIDDEKEYSLGGEGSLMVQDLADPEDCVQVDAKEFSDFERSVWWFLQGA
jgi:hypothetical protein